METRIAPIIAAALLGLCAGACGSVASNFEMHPQAVVEDKTVDSNTAILLVGNAGPASIGYVQFVHSFMPAINVGNIVLPPNGIIAVPVPVGITNMEINCYTIAGRGGGYLPSGMSVGFIPVHTPRMNITAHGVYYVATIVAGEARKFTVTPDPGMLKQFKSTHPQIARLTAVNFSWPK